MKKEQVSFKVSSALKSIIGKDLITNDQVAIFELVKNSYDANATEVRIVFKDLNDQSQASIIISDNGEGMDGEAIRNKWLFVAYSDKKNRHSNQTRQIETNEDDVQDKRAYAGAKGIGRFACDRLGRKLKLTSISKLDLTKQQILNVDWGAFEEDDLFEFANIHVDHQELDVTPKMQGTQLVISELNAVWDRRSIISLRKELAKLISPDQLNSNQFNFNVYIECEDELFNDNQQQEKYPEYVQHNKLVNGKIVNPLFNVLIPRTIRVTSKCQYSDEHGRNVIQTKIIDRGVELATFGELSDYSYLDKTSIELYYVNRSAKILFKRFMGDDLVRYGSTLVYKNNIRILPFGKPDDDSFGLDKRKGQGTRRFFGTRELFGIISITDEYQMFTETSSRDGGFIENAALYQLKEYLMRVVKILEKYVIDISDWGIDGEEFDNFQDEESKIKFAKYIDSMSRDSRFVNVDMNELVKKLAESKDSATTLGLIKKIRRDASASGLISIEKNIDVIEKKITETIKAKESAETNNLVLETKNKQLEKQTLFLQSNINNNVRALESYHHQVFLSIEDINEHVKDLVNHFKRNPNKEMIETVREMQKSLAKINVFTSIALKATFSYESETINEDMASFIAQYLTNKSDRFSIDVFNENEVSFVTEFDISDIMIILDNMINNAKKARATWIKFDISGNLNRLQLDVSDNGNGINPEIFDNIFSYGFTTHEEGTGIGLFHVQEIVSKYNGSINVLPSDKGAKFVLTIGAKNGS